MKNRYLALGLAIVLALALAIPALGGSSDPTATVSASAKTIAKKAKKKARKAKQIAKSAKNSADAAQTTANVAQAAAEAATPLWAVVEANGNLERGKSATASTKLGGNGLYEVTFNRNLSQCSWVGQIGTGNTTPTIYGEMSIFLQSGNPNALFVQTAGSNGALSDRPFHLMVHC
jgi:hypothetical protein